MQQQRPLLRVRNHFVLQARSSERLHAISLLVQLRECDVAHFNHSSSDHAAASSDSVDFVEHLLELLDDDPDFQQIVQELDALRPGEAPSSSSNKNSNGANYKLISASQWMKAQWRVLDPQTNRSLGNVLQRTHKRRSDCFTREDAKQSVRKTQEASSEDEVYTGDMYKPLPMRKLTVEVWMYPPHVVIPAIGDRIPADDTSVIDFFQTVGNES
uniref:Uncharacterized protein n=1 Tax=Globisporangium ultimum (strain ATCC 200006 / CBS 805.95 / DAOM BR144) TaxID=431595 RepID=K3WRM8_GLOUD